MVIGWKVWRLYPGDKLVPFILYHPLLPIGPIPGRLLHF